MRLRLIGVAALLALMPVRSGSAADLKQSTMKDGRVVVSMSGEIADGDTDRLKAAIKIANDAGKFVSSVRLNSEGGNLLEGVKLAETVKFAKMATNVGPGATCASACFLVFAAGETKFANYTAQIGVHGASDQAGQETAQSSAATVSMARVAKELGVPAAIIGRMVVTPPSEMVWLSPADLQTMGTTMIGKPAQVSIIDKPAALPQQTAPAGEPRDLAPNAKASAPPTWDDFVKVVVAQSSKQNNGVPRSARVCQPEFKVCVNSVSWTNPKGIPSSIKVVRDMNDQIILREYCTFNESMDIRKCLDWDTGKSHRDMQDVKGNWQRIADE